MAKIDHKGAGARVSKPIIRAENFQVVTFYDKEAKRQVLILYALGEDGVIREFRGGEGWFTYPIPGQHANNGEL